MRLEVSGYELVTTALVVYVLSPVDCWPESHLGARGLLDDLVVVWLLAVGFASWFALVVVVFETAVQRTAAAAAAPAFTVSIKRAVKLD